MGVCLRLTQNVFETSQTRVSWTCDRRPGLMRSFDQKGTSRTTPLSIMMRNVISASADIGQKAHGRVKIGAT